MIESLHPGEIDNSPLQGLFGDEMKRGSVDGRDYVLMPTNIAMTLFEKYKGGPQFPRKVLNVGTHWQQILQVNLFPIRIEVYHCDKYQSEPVETENRFKRRYFSKNLPLSHVADDLRGMFHLPDLTYTVRYWIKQAVPEAIRTNKTHGGRLLTCDVVDFDGEWRFVRNELRTRNIQEILGESDCISLIVESVSVRAPRDSEWPRYQKLDKWKDSLQVGDMIDCKDNRHKYYDAVIKEIDENGTLSVHFIGWDEGADEKVTASEIHTRIQPLHSNSFDRSKWEENDRLDVRIMSSEGKAIWIVSTIIEVDPLNDRVQVLLDAKEKAEALAKKPVNKGYGTSVSNLMDDGDEYDADDDNKKKTTIVSTSADVAAAVDSLKEWHDIYSDSICPLHTHTPAVRSVTTSTAVTSYTGNYNYNSSNFSSGSGYGLSSIYNSNNSYSYDRNTKGTPPVAGAVGLQNLGNTCFMNSILQCLSNTQLLTEMFTQGAYKEQINYDNPLGHNGKIAMTYGKLIKEIWSGAYTKVVPREFKSVIGEFRPQFAGYDQQDSQELMSCCLDGLHEDLNRIIRKPYTKKIESKGRPDDLIAEESWRRFLQRNDSMIVEKFFGQQKSHVTCKSCGKESVTFDEFSSLSLPIPVRNTRIITVIVQLLPLGSALKKVQLEVELTAPMSQLKKVLVDRLVECGLIEPLATSEGGNMSVATSNGNMMAVEDNDFELINREEVPSIVNNNGDDYQMIVEGEDGKSPQITKETMDVAEDDQAPVNKTAAAKAKKAAAVSPYDRFHFHFGVIYGQRPATVFKNYNTADSKNTAISAFVTKMDTLIAFQLDLPVPDFKGLASYSSYNNYGVTKPIEVKVEPTCFGMDLMLAYKLDMRYELMGYPYRLSFVKGASNSEVHATARNILASLLDEDSPLHSQDPRTWPYDVYVTTAYASMTNRKVEDNDMNFLELREGQEILVAVWRPEAVRAKHVILEKAKLVIDLDAGKESADGDSNDEMDDDDDNLYSTPSKKGKAANIVSPSKKKSKRLSIYDCLDKYVEKEQLADTETLYCNRCKEMLAPIKKMDIWTSPDVLILHLKRFQFVAGQYMVLRDKINDVVDFPIEGLDLSEYVRGPQATDAPPVYDLFAVSHHMGGLGGGHYTATCRNFLNGQWYNFNDSSVSVTEPTSAVASTAYVLFYRRR